MFAAVLVGFQYRKISLRRAYAEWIRKDEKTGWGYGVYVYTG